MRYVILGTAGHIDHGKSSLVNALTGIDTDRLKEEKDRGITIDIGFADLAYPDDELTVGIVDVPGHEKLISNMLAGAGALTWCSWSLLRMKASCRRTANILRSATF